MSGRKCRSSCAVDVHPGLTYMSRHQVQLGCIPPSGAPRPKEGCIARSVDQTYQVSLGDQDSQTHR
jgi:hypothetical protein